MYTNDRAIGLDSNFFKNYIRTYVMKVICNKIFTENWDLKHLSAKSMRGI